MEFGFAIPAYGPWLDRGAIADLVTAGDELGFDSVWWPDHIATPDYGRDYLLEPPFLEPMAACGWALGRTQRIRVGTDVLVAPYRPALTVGAMAGTLDHFEPGRFILGVGIGYLRGEFDALEVSYGTRAQVTEQFLHDFRHPPDGYSVMPRASVPLWVGGNSRKAQVRAALLGDGWHPLWMPAEQYAAARALILSSRAEAGRSGPFTFSYSCGATRVLDRDPGDWPAPRGRAPVGTEFSYAPAEMVDDERRPRFVGTPDQIIGDLTQLHQAGVEHITLRFASTDASQLERFAADVRPALKVEAGPEN